MPDQRQTSDLSLFVDILRTLEALDAPYVIIGAFAATVYGITRATFDIDFIVNLSERHIQALAAHYPPPRYYADPDQMRNSIRLGIMFNIIDSSRGEKADLVPATMHPRYPQVLVNRVRQQVKAPGEEPFEAWCASPEDVIIGKLMAWTEGRSRKHETDIYEMLVFHYLGLDPTISFNEHIVNTEAEALGQTTADFWEAVKKAARQEADRLSSGLEE
ncbi:MAG: hypothetical protein BroJett011_33100 [Chloroflexota bacterium]|nr:MAG: hypothetical protein BroJett011_33100 [Chloroflexota bacterium]